MSNRIPLGFFFIFLILSSSTIHAQEEEPIKLRNPSFNGEPEIAARVIKGWYNCGFHMETPPDIQPNLDPFGNGFFGVTQKAYKDSTYLGMVVRDNDTYEAVGQRLRSPIRKGQCYDFSMHLARSRIYYRQDVPDDNTVVVDTQQEQPPNMDQPVIIRVWGGNGYCGKRELLGETGLIKNSIWKKYKMRFEPTEQHSFILIEAYYRIPTVMPYNGNVLIDNLSDIVPVPCSDDPQQTEEPILASVDNLPITEPESPQPQPEQPVVEEEPVEEVYSYSNPAPEEAPSSGTVIRKEEKTLQGFKRDDLRRGQTIKLSRLYFEVDDSTINVNSFAALDELYDFMQLHKGVKVEIRGHTDGSCDAIFCDRLSLARAKAVVNYLVQKGIAQRRLAYEGYGKRKPIASNKYASGRKKNRRVEVKILSLDG